MKGSILFWGKIIVQIALFGIFLRYFGIVCWQRYQARKVVVTSSEYFQGELPTPAVTVCPENPEILRNLSEKSLSDPIGSWCGQNEETETYQCIESVTNNLTSSIRAVTCGHQEESPDVNREEWISDFTAPGQGMCFTFKRRQDMGIDFVKHSIMIHFLSNMSYIFIHDPEFFAMNWNPALPFNNFLLEGNFVRTFKMITVQHRKINVPSAPCNPDTTYSFTACIKEVFSREFIILITIIQDVLSREVGCRLPWDGRTDSSYPLCGQLDQFRSLTTCLGISGNNKQHFSKRHT